MKHMMGCAIFPVEDKGSAFTTATGLREFWGQEILVQGKQKCQIFDLRPFPVVGPA
jgi:hypothetical protein